MQLKPTEGDSSSDSRITLGLLNVGLGQTTNDPQRSFPPGQGDALFITAIGASLMHCSFGTGGCEQRVLEKGKCSVVWQGRARIYTWVIWGNAAV